ncbi:pseudouridine synthase deg1 [Cryomyces antarcticus]|uniref:Pseudouridine synthase deg1 n=1 Tax=Cryomyces antarcticus TaxID=329879 RepID=A0ABR0M9A3_9PEZI|nr:pseudouridine synthase deg1 [Cryomyces antarcticus]KAK5019268.1 pseudouridine synthase deg1 [Cryomyces antarcticus]KAK5296638.1 pseudouridine synthase deg1 [Cryomyces antarcticus]
MAEPANYADWSNEQLIARVMELEQRLKGQTKSFKPSRTTISDRVALPYLPKQKSRPVHAFDPSKYSTRFIALKFAYLGRAYNGFEHHANNKTPLPTVEEVLWRALMKTKLIFPTKDGVVQGDADGGVNWEGCEYSKCGRTDKGVSAFGQVIAIRVRSNRKVKRQAETNITRGDPAGTQENDVRAERDANIELHDREAATVSLDAATEEVNKENAVSFDPIRDELPYIQLLNRVLPEDIRVLAWCPSPPANFSARFSCKERRYKYFFTQPAFLPIPGADGVIETANTGLTREGWLDVGAMREAAKQLVGLHDFRNFCKVDPAKQITNFERRIYHASIEEVPKNLKPLALVSDSSFAPTRSVFRTCWTQEETEFLLRSTRQGMSDDEISDLLPGRTSMAVSLRRRAIDPKGTLVAAAEEPDYSSFDWGPVSVAQYWTAEDDALLKQSRAMGQTWLETTRLFDPPRSLHACKSYYYSLRTPTQRSPSTSGQNFHKTYWDRNEYALLMRGIDESKSFQEMHDEYFPHRSIAGLSKKYGEVQRLEGFTPKIYTFTVHGSAFLWHQVRHLAAILFLVGQGLEPPSIVSELLDITKTPTKPKYEMATDTPLVLWDCIFPAEDSESGEDALDWIYVGDDGGIENSKRSDASAGNGKFGRGGVMDDLWSIWRKRKIDEMLAGTLLDVVAAQGTQNYRTKRDPESASRSARVFDGGDRPKLVGKYVPVLHKERMESVEAQNTRYAARKGLVKRETADVKVDDDADE